ncbi:MAG: UDP-glucose/GDP-mannose dehydrogenase family protein [Chlamydiales bacterium]|nr:UDP-glucose/GDP-mannose dehydrogenase family protein [Chlamydiales bacterium]
MSRRQDCLFSNTYLIQSLEQIGLALAKKQRYHLIVITSTVVPGSTEGPLRAVLEKASGLHLNKDFGLCYNPEFIALGSVIKNMLYPDMLLIGESDARAGDLLEKVYSSVCVNTPFVRRMNMVSAELAKIAINTFVTTKISYANMLSDMCDKLIGADVDVVTEAIGLDSRIGSKYLKGSVPFGGPCFPRDNIALVALARSIGARADIAEATQSINAYQFERLYAQIAQRAKTPRVAILGLSYKPHTSVVEESQGIRIANQLIKAGYEVMVYDPQALQEAQKYLDAEISLAESCQRCVEWADTLVIMTAWPEFIDAIGKGLSDSLPFSKTVIDCWRILDKDLCTQLCELVYLGYGKSALCDQACTL